MIQKEIVGAGFRGVLEYVFRASQEVHHGQARIIDTNMAARTPRCLAAEFGSFRGLNERVRNPVYHCSLRLPDGEELRESQWASFCRDYLAGLGFTNTPYLVVSHAQGHVHIIASRVRADGSSVRDSFQHLRSNRLVHELEERYSLSYAFHPDRRRQPSPHLTRNEIAQAERTGHEPPKVQIARRIDTAVQESDGTRDGFDRVLDELGVTTRWNVLSTGRVRGASYELRGDTGEFQHMVKGSQMGNEYGWGHVEARLAQRLREVVQEREQQASVAQEQSQDPKRGAAGDHQEEKPRADGRATTSLASVHAPNHDRTGRAVMAQLVGMGWDRYEVGLRTPDKGMLLRTYNSAELVTERFWLKAMNARGHDIYIRPEGSTGLILLDDLKRDTLDRMARAGLPPSVVTETSPGNYQAWVRLSWQPMPKDLATAAARELAERFGGDLNAADWRHFGRLAGFTNRKPAHTRPDGLQPYVHLVESQAREAPHAWQIIERAQERLAARPVPPRAPLQVHQGREDQSAVPGLGDVYRTQVSGILNDYPRADRSAVDWGVTKHLAKAYPQATRRDLCDAMREGSPQVLERKGRHAEDYIERTVVKALQQPDVIMARQHSVLTLSPPREPISDMEEAHRHLRVVPNGGNAKRGSCTGASMADALLETLDEQPQSVLRHWPDHDDPYAARIQAAVRRRQERSREQEHDRSGR